MTTIELKHPITVDGVEIKEINLRRPKAVDLEVMDKAPGEVGKAILLISNLAELPLDKIRELDGEDFMGLQGHLTDFLGVA